MTRRICRRVWAVICESAAIFARQKPSAHNAFSSIQTNHGDQSEDNVTESSQTDCQLSIFIVTIANSPFPELKRVTWQAWVRM